MKYLFFLCFSIISTVAISQNKLTPVSWEFEVSTDDDGNKVLVSTAKLDDKWAMYSQHTGEGGPIPLTFTYDEGPSLIGKTIEMSDPIKKMSKMFEIEVIKFKDEAVFNQKFTASSGVNKISGTLRYMCCDDLRCLPPTEVPFEVAF